MAIMKWPAMPTDAYIIDVFERYVNNNKSEFDTYIEDIPVDKTMSLFHCSKKSFVMSTILNGSICSTA